MAIKEFIIGPQNYFEPGYFNGDYTESNVSRAFLECDVDNIKGGRVVTGEYFLDNYIDGTYYHDNSIRSNLVCEVMVVQEAEMGLGGYYQDGYFTTGYFTRTGTFFSLNCITGIDQFAQAAISVSASTSTTAGKLNQFTVSITAAFTQTATISHIEGVDLFAFSEASISVAVNRIRNNNIAASAAFSVATDVSRIRNNSSDDAAQFSFTATTIRSRDYYSAQSAAFSLSANIFRIRSVSSTINSEIILIDSSNRIRSSAVSLNSEFTQTAAVRKIRDAHLTGTGVAAINCNATSNIVSSASLQSVVTVYFNGGKQTLASSALTAVSGMVVSRYAGSDRPKTISGSFNGYALINSATRITDLSDLANATDWYYQTQIYLNASNYFRNYDTGELLYIPLGTRNGAARYIQITSRYRPTGTVISVVGQFAPNNVVGQLNVGDSASSAGMTVAISFTGGQKLAVYINAQRVGLISDVLTNSWTISNPQTVSFSSGWPFTLSPSSVHTAQTDYAWFTYGNYTNSGAVSYSTPTPINTADTIFLYQFDGSGVEDLALTLTGSSAINVSTSVIASIGGITNASSSLSSTASLSATISHIEGADIVVNGFASLSASAQKLKIVQSQTLSEFSQNTNGNAVRDGVSSISVSANSSANILRIQESPAVLQVAASQLTAVVRLAGLFADDLTQFSLSVSPVKIGSAIIAQSSEFTQDSNLTRIRYSASSIVSQSSISADADVRLTTNASLSNQATLTVSTFKYTGIVAGLSGTFTINAQANNLGKIEATAFDNILLAATVQRLREPALPTQTIVSTVSANIVVKRNAGSVLTVNASQSVLSDRRRNTSAALQVTGSKLIAVVKQAAADVDVNVVSTLSATIKKIAGVNENISASSTISGNILRIRTSVINTLAVQSTVSATGIKQIVEGAAVLQVSAAKLIVIAKTTGISLDVSVSASLAVTASVFRGHGANISGAFTQTTTPLKKVSLQSSQSVFSSVSITSTVVIQGTVVISSAMTFVSLVREIRLDEIVYVIPGEIWVYDITQETRQYTIGSETRTYIITQGD